MCARACFYLFLLAQVIGNYLGRVVAMISITFHDFKSRVRWLTVNVVRILSMYSWPTLQVKYHHKIMPALISMIADFHYPHLQVYYFSTSLLLNSFPKITAFISLNFDYHLSTAITCIFRIYTQHLSVSCSLLIFEFRCW